MLSVRVNWVDLTCQLKPAPNLKAHTDCDRLNSIFSKYFHNNSLAVAHSTHKTLTTRAPHCVRAHHMERRNSKIFAEIKKTKKSSKNISSSSESWHLLWAVTPRQFDTFSLSCKVSETKFSVFSFSQQLSLLNQRQFTTKRGIVVW